MYYIQTSDYQIPCGECGSRTGILGKTYLGLHWSMFLNSHLCGYCQKEKYIDNIWYNLFNRKLYTSDGKEYWFKLDDENNIYVSAFTGGGIFCRYYCRNYRLFLKKQYESRLYTWMVEYYSGKYWLSTHNSKPQLLSEGLPIYKQIILKNYLDEYVYDDFFFLRSLIAALIASSANTLQCNLTGGRDRCLEIS